MPGSHFQRLVKNAGSALTSEMVNRASTFILYALIARWLGAFSLGQMALALTIFYIAQVLAVAGLKTLITREVARDPSRAKEYLIHGSALVLVSSALSLGTIALLVRVLGYTPETAEIVLLVTLALLPSALASVCEGVLQAREEMTSIVIANVPATLLKVVGALVLLNLGHGLSALAFVFIGAHVAVAAVEYAMTWRRVGAQQASFRVETLPTLARQTGAFLGIDGVVAVFSSAEVLMLSKLVDEAAVGLYGAAAQLLVPMLLVCQSVVLSAFPMMCRSARQGADSLTSVTAMLLGVLLAGVLPVAVGLFFLAEPLLMMIYAHRSFESAALVLQILTAGLVLRTFTLVLGHVLLAHGQEHTTLRIVVVDAAIGLVAGIVLIHFFGVAGAAMSVVVTRSVDAIQHAWAAAPLLARLGLNRLGWCALGASAVMALALAFLPSRDLLIAGASSGAVYGAALAALVLAAFGGPRQLRTKSMETWTQ